MNICLFTNDEINKSLPKSDERAEHLLKILHKNVGDSFTAGVIDGQGGIATISSITEDSIYFNFEPKNDGKLLRPLNMIIGFPRPIQLKRLLRDIAALGVNEVHLTGTELGEKSYMKSTLVEKGSAYKMLLDGTVQAGSTHVPHLYLHQSLKECLEECNKKEDDCLRLALDNINPKCNLKEAMQNPCKIAYAAIGSERGWTDKERKLLEEYGYIRCGMGERIMRTETASTVAGAIILDRMGDLY